VRPRQHSRAHGPQASRRSNKQASRLINGLFLGNARIRFWIEIALAALEAGLALLTIFTREWIELLFGIDPDQGSGALEWAIVGALFVASVALALAARWDRNRHIASV
jgi:hypothetical protein